MKHPEVVNISIENCHMLMTPFAIRIVHLLRGVGGSLSAAEIAEMLELPFLDVVTEIQGLAEKQLVEVIETGDSVRYRGWIRSWEIRFTGEFIVLIINGSIELRTRIREVRP